MKSISLISYQQKLYKSVVNPSDPGDLLFGNSFKALEHSFNVMSTSYVSLSISDSIGISLSWKKLISDSIYDSGLFILVVYIDCYSQSFVLGWVSYP